MIFSNNCELRTVTTRASAWARTLISKNLNEVLQLLLRRYPISKTKPSFIKLVVDIRNIEIARY